jgi:hypothetical protein
VEKRLNFLAARNSETVQRPLHFHRSLEMRIETIERGLSIGLQFCVDFAAGNREYGKKINGVLRAVNSLQASIAVTTCYISSITYSTNGSLQRSTLWDEVFLSFLRKKRERKGTRFAKGNASSFRYCSLQLSSASQRLTRNGLFVFFIPQSYFYHWIPCNVDTFNFINSYKWLTN